MKVQIILLILLFLVGCMPLDPYANPASLSCKDLTKRFDTYFHDAYLNKFPQGKPIYVGATLINKSIIGDLGSLTWQGRKDIASFSVIAAMKAIEDIPLEQGQFYRFDINRFKLSGEYSGVYALDKEDFADFEQINCH